MLHQLIQKRTNFSGFVFIFWTLSFINANGTEDDDGKIIKKIKLFQDQECSYYREDSLDSSFEEIHPVYPEICQYLKIGDICTVRQVCRGLNNAAKHVLLTKGPCVSPVAIKSNTPNFIPLKNLIDIEPELALFFMSVYGSSPGVYNDNIMELFANYGVSLPTTTRILIIEDASVLIDNTRMSPNDNNAAGVFFPNKPNVKLRSAFIHYLEISENTYDVEKLGLEIFSPKDKHETSALLMFTSDFYSEIVQNTLNQASNDISDYTNKLKQFYAVIIEKIIQRYRTQRRKFAIWGGQVAWIDGFRNYYGNAIEWLAVTISGPDVRSWSKPIDTTTTDQCIENQLKDFKSHVNYRKTSKTIAMAIISTSFNLYEQNDLKYHQKDIDKIKIFKKLFPSLKLMTLGVHEDGVKFCTDSTLEQNDVQIQFNSDYACFIIISYP